MSPLKQEGAYMAISVESQISLAMARSDDAVLRSTLIKAGVSASSIQRRVARGILLALPGAVVANPNPRSNKRQAHRAALLPRPRGALGFETAARYHSLPVQDNGPPHVVIPHGLYHDDGVNVIHQTRSLPSADLATSEGFVVTSVARTLVDLASISTQNRILHLFQYAIKEQLVTVSHLGACIRPLSRGGRRGIRASRLAMMTLFDEEPHDLSHLEIKFADLSARAGISGLVAQFQPPWYDGRRGIVDFAIPELKIIVELDGRRWHSLQQDQFNDRNRDRIARRQGWIVIRYGWDEVVHRPEEVVEDLIWIIGSRRDHNAA